MTSSRTCSSPFWTSVTSTFLRQAFFPFLDGCLCCCGAPAETINGFTIGIVEFVCRKFCRVKSYKIMKFASSFATRKNYCGDGTSFRRNLSPFPLWLGPGPQRLISCATLSSTNCFDESSNRFIRIRYLNLPHRSLLLHRHMIFYPTWRKHQREDPTITHSRSLSTSTRLTQIQGLTQLRRLVFLGEQSGMQYSTLSIFTDCADQNFFKWAKPRS